MGEPTTGVSVHVTTGVPGTEGQGNGQGGGLISGENFNILLSLFQGKSVEGASGTEGNISQTTLKIMLGSDFKGDVDIDITSPKLEIPDELLISIAIDVIGSQGLDENHPLSILIKVIKDGNESSDEVEGDLQADKSGSKNSPLPPQVKCALLGGLVMVALSELLQDYAKQQSAMEKMMSEMWIETEAMLKDLAKSMAANILEKAEVQAMSNILQAVFAGCACAMSVGGGAFALNKMSGHSASSISQKTTTQAQTMNTFGSAGSQAFNGVAGGIVKAWESLAVGEIDAEQKILENVEQQLQKMVDKYSSEGSEASKRVSDALDLLKNAISALLNAFKGLGGGHSS